VLRLQVQGPQHQKVVEGRLQVALQASVGVLEEPGRQLCCWLLFVGHWCWSGALDC
jgi:hypothetical protein